MRKPHNRICTIADCGKKEKARGFCTAHYYRWQKNGDPNVVRMKQSPAGAPRAFIEALPGEGLGCVKWPFATNGAGYAQINLGQGRKVLVSRYVCELRNGPPPSESHQAAHSCGKGHEACVAPWHLDWKTPKENMADQYGHGTRSRKAA